MTTFHTLDTLIAALQAQIDSGVAGNTPVGYPDIDNNCTPGYWRRIEGVGTAPIVQSELDKEFELCRVSKRGGLPCIILK